MTQELSVADKVRLDHLIKERWFFKSHLYDGKCKRCGTQLTDPASIALGIGPECRKKIGAGGRQTMGEKKAVRWDLKIYEPRDPFNDHGPWGEKETVRDLSYYHKEVLEQILKRYDIEHKWFGVDEKGERC